MSASNGGAAPMQPRAVPLIGQKFIEDFPAELRKFPEGTAIPVVFLMKGDKEQMIRIEQKLDRLLSLIEPETAQITREA